MELHTVGEPTNAMIWLPVVSYWYHFDSDNWSVVYKHTVGKDYKLKAGYDSEVRLGWASLWVSFTTFYLNHVNVSTF